MEQSNLNRLPLLPTSPIVGIISCLEASYIIRDSFRDYLQRDVNIIKTKTMKEIIEEYEVKCSDIRSVENEMMKINAKLIMCLKENKLLKELNITDKFVTRYNLISLSDLKPTVSEQFAAGFRVEHEENRRKMLTYLPPPTKGTGIIFSPGRPSISCKFNIEEQFKHRRPLMRKRKPPFIVANRQDILFTEFTIGGSYHESLTLLNASMYPCKFNLSPPKQISLFNVTWTQLASDQPRLLAPGSTLNLDVTFQCRDLDDVYDAFHISFSEHCCYRVPLKAKRKPPCLTSTCYLGVSRSNLTNEEECLSFSIDCGPQLVGTKVEFSTMLFNIEADSTYFITNEVAWTFSDISDKAEDDVVEAHPFTIRPIYFSLLKDSSVNLTISFSPDCEGTCTQQFFIICNNLTVRKVDVLGDGLMFYSEKILFKGMEKNFNIDMDDDMEAEYYMDLGTILSFGYLRKTFYVSSLSQIKHKFHWEIRDANIEGTTSISNHLGVFPSSGCFDALSRKQFCILCRTKNRRATSGRSVIRLIVDNLPTDSIKSSETHKITHIGKNNMVSICVGEIEVWLEIEQPYIELSHYYLSFFTRPLIVQKLDVAAYNRSCASLKVQWERKVNQIVEIYVEPEKAVIGKDSVHIFRLCVRFVQEGEFSDTIRCVLCNHDMYINVRLEGRTEPSTVISSDILDFGLIKQGAEVRKKCYLVTNSSSEVSGCLRELSYESNDNGELGLTELKKINLGCIRSTAKFVTPLGFEYKLDTKEPKICMRLLEWLIGGQVSYTHVIGDVQTTDVCLNPSGEWKIDQGPLYVGTHRSLAPFRLHNRTRLPTKFYWKPPIETVCRVDVLPAKGTLLPAEDKDIRVIIYPKTEGKIDDIKILCYTELMSEPLTVSVICRVEDVSLLIVWDTVCGKQEIYYPYEPGTPKSSFNAVLPDNNCSMCFTPSKSDLEILDSVEYRMLHFVGSDYSSFPYKNWPIIGGKYIYENFEYSNLKLQFENLWKLSNLQKTFSSCSLEVRDYLLEKFRSSAISFSMNVSESESKVIRIKNMTPIRTSILIRTDRISKKKGMTYVRTEAGLSSQIYGATYESLKGESNYETSRDCKMCRGLNVDVEPEINELEGDGNVEMNVTVKPDLWGLYFETLEVRVPSLQSVFHVPVFVEAKGHPVFFTFAPDNQSPVFSFGSLKHGEGLSHHFTLRNRTCLPIKVAWTTYTIPSGSRHEAEFCLPDVRPKFWMGVDLHNPDDMKFCSIRLMEYFGNQECCTYKIEPSVVYLPPKGEANISATVRTDKCWFDVNHLGTDLLGTAVGLIYVDTNKDYEKGCFRPSGFDLEPLKLQLKTKVQISTLRPLNATREDLTFKVRATDVMLSSKEVYKVSKKLSFRNTGDSVAHVYFSTTEPFEIGGILQIDPSFARELSPCEALLKGGQIVEVTIVLNITRTDVSEYLNNTENDEREASTLSESSQKYSRNLNMKQTGYIEQKLSLEYYIIMPNIQVSQTGLDFGPVYINDTKVKHFRLFSLTGNEPFVIHTKSKSNVGFTFVTKNCLAQSTIPVDVCVYFTPTENKSYFETLIINTSVPRIYTEISLNGFGTWDYKWHCFDCPPQNKC